MADLQLIIMAGAAHLVVVVAVWAVIISRRKLRDEFPPRRTIQIVDGLPF